MSDLTALHRALTATATLTPSKGQLIRCTVPASRLHAASRQSPRGALGAYRLLKKIGLGRRAIFSRHCGSPLSPTWTCCGMCCWGTSLMADCGGNDSDNTRDRHILGRIHHRAKIGGAPARDGSGPDK